MRTLHFVSAIRESFVKVNYHCVVCCGLEGSKCFDDALSLCLALLWAHRTEGARLPRNLRQSDPFLEKRFSRFRDRSNKSAIETSPLGDLGGRWASRQGCMGSARPLG